MGIEPGSLSESSQRVVRLNGRELLARVSDEFERLDAEGETDALHDFRVALRRLRSWMRAFEDELSETMRPKARRRLKRIAEATRGSRDLEVHIQWVERFARSRRVRYERATEWLLDRLRRDKKRADVELRTIMQSDYSRTKTQVAQGLGRYIVDLDAPEASFGSSLGALIVEHSEAARHAMARVSNIADRREAHRARIAVKRLRYLLESVKDAVPGVEPVVDKLARLQDDLGALHDAQIFGSEIAKLLATELAAETPSDVDSDAVALDNAEPNPDDRAAGLRAMSQRLHREEVRAFAQCKTTWLAGGADELWTAVDSIGDKLKVDFEP